jgi:hypothetical protein
MLEGMRKHLTGYVKLKKKIRDKHYIIKSRFGDSNRRPGRKYIRFGEPFLSLSFPFISDADYNLHEIINANDKELVNFATSKNLVVKSTMFPHRNIHKYTWTSPDGKTHDQIDHILVDRRRH